MRYCNNWSKTIVGMAIAWRFIVNRKQQTIHVYASCTELVPTIKIAPDAVMGIDFNKNFFEVAVVARTGQHAGNRIWHWCDKFRGRSPQQTRDNINKIFKNYCALAQIMHWAIIYEDLDFAKKKTKNLGPCNNKMLSQWLTAHVSDSIERHSARYGVLAIAVNPAYTSLIGEYKFSGYGYSRHESAAITIARRGLGWGERLVCKNPNTDKLLVKKVCHHVWSNWAKVQNASRAKTKGKVVVTKVTTVTNPVGRGMQSTPMLSANSPSSGP
jgi:IS605 OrfB family transposase